MNKNKCVTEKNSSRVMGFVILPLGLVLAFAGSLFLSIFGLFLALPFFLFAGVLIAAPESRECKLLIGNEA